MRINEYNNLEEFIYQYDSGRSISSDEFNSPKYMGIEFKYNNEYYRMCREPYDNDKKVILENGKIGVYDVIHLDCSKSGYPMVDKNELIGWYSDLYDVLENCLIQERKFKDVIMDDNTEILGQD